MQGNLQDIVQTLLKINIGSLIVNSVANYVIRNAQQVNTYVNSKLGEYLSNKVGDIKLYLRLSQSGIYILGHH